MLPRLGEMLLSTSFRAVLRGKLVSRHAVSFCQGLVHWQGHVMTGLHERRRFLIASIAAGEF
jgi:hypothetical protein